MPRECTNVLWFDLAVPLRPCERVRRALRPVVQQARAYVQLQDTNIDETPWRERSRRRWLWTAVAPQVSVFQIAPTCGAPEHGLLVSTLPHHHACCMIS